MYFNLKNLSRDQKILILALLIASIITVVYLVSGQKSYDQNSRELKNSDPEVKEVKEKSNSNGEKLLEVKCQDGSSYDIYYPPGEGNYDSLSASKCQP
jgi:cell division protein FtsL